MFSMNERLKLCEKENEELKTEIKNLRAVNTDLRDGWDKTLEEKDANSN